MWNRLTDQKEFALSNVLMKMKFGSHLYGTNIPTSDVDYVGIFAPHLDTVLGFSTCLECDCSSVVKRDDGKNAPESVDFKLYEVRQFLKLLSQGNPNIVEMIFVNGDNLLDTSSVFEEIRKNQSIFVHKGIHSRFIGYAISQENKMLIKSENVECFVKFLEILTKISRLHDPVYSIDFTSTGFSINEESNAIKVGDINIQANISIINAIKIVKKRYDRASYRKDTIIKYGYDVKFGMHLIRLLYEGISLLKHGKLEFPLKEKQQLLDIRLGKYSVTEVLELASSLKNESREALTKSVIPNKIDQEKYREIFIKSVTNSMRDFQFVKKPY